MPKYPIDDLPRTAADPITAHMFLGIAVYGLCVGIGFILFGLRGRQHWLAAWGSGLSLCSMIYLLYRLLE